MNWCVGRAFSCAGPLSWSRGAPILTQREESRAILPVVTSFRHYATAALIIALSGCIHTQPVPQKVFIPVPAPCLKPEQLPKPPAAKSDAELAAMTDFDLVISLATDRLEYRRYANEASATLIACTK